jgi:cytoskeletal protein CcmA (bactofilin family)
VSPLDRALRYLGLSDPLGDDRPQPAPAGRGGALLGAGLSFRGNLSGEGDFQIAGRFEGDISVTGRVTVAEGAEVEANITAFSIQVGGTVRGNLSASTRVEILPTGVVTGSLKTGSFSAADGASMKGEVWVDPGASTRGPERKP